MNKSLGQRICLIGMSSTGKSTLAHRLGEKLNLPVVHLDQLHHLPDGNWVKRPREEFISLHDTAIQKQEWIMEGNYTQTMPQRFDRASTIIHLKMNRFMCLYRFIRRYFERKRGKACYGSPENLEEKLNLSVIWWIIEPQFLNKSRNRKNRLREALLKKHQDKIIVMKSFSEIDNFIKSAEI